MPESPRRICDEQIVSHTLESMDNLMIAPENRFCLVVGRRVAERLETAGQPVGKSFPVPGGVSGITPLVQEILIAVEDWRASQNINRIILFYHKPSARMAFRP
ncbi:MAG: hypothetical protein PHW74_12705 [Desulfobacca sp.]|nr:hypothetical protein [Desulfobacca sp.]